MSGIVEEKQDRTQGERDGKNGKMLMDYRDKTNKGEITECVMRGNEREDLRHFILECPAYQEERRHPGLQRPYQEEEDQVIGRILFENENTNTENTKKH